MEETRGVSSSFAKEVKRLKSLSWRQKEKIKGLTKWLDDALMREKQAKGLVASAETDPHLSHSIKQFIRFQLRNASRVPHGRRFSEPEYMQALAMYFQGPRGYRHLRKQFILPSPRVLRKKMQDIRLHPGFHDAVLAILQDKLKGADERDKLCLVTFDEMAIKKKFTYLRGEDRIEGHEDFGQAGASAEPADHALVLMVRGLSKKWKQCLGYFLSSGTTRGSTQKDLILEAIRKLRGIGLRPVATVCDMGRPNQQTYRLLGVENGQFLVDGQKVMALCDVPHLFKCLRNALLKNTLTVDGHVAKWEHVLALYDVDSKRQLRAAPKLKRGHVHLQAFKKMSVRLATQLMSRSVAAAMSLYQSFGEHSTLSAVMLN